MPPQLRSCLSLLTSGRRSRWLTMGATATSPCRAPRASTASGGCSRCTNRAGWGPSMLSRKHHSLLCTLYADGCSTCNSNQRVVITDFCIAGGHQIQTSAASSRRGAQLTWFLGWTGVHQSPPSHGCGFMCLRCWLLSELHPGVILTLPVCVEGSCTCRMPSGR